MWSGFFAILGCFASEVVGGSPWSLIQSKASVQSSIGMVSSASDALTIVQNLAEKVVGHNVPLTDDEKTAINTIKDYITRLLKDIKEWRGKDQREAERYRAAVTACGTMARDLLAGEVATAKKDTDDERQRHSQCREAELGVISKTSMACQTYDMYRSTPPGNAPPKCMNSLTGDDVASTDAATKKAMEQCITDINDWVVPLYEKYIKCKNAVTDRIDFTRKCDDYQLYFEQQFCLYAGELDTVCSTQTSCRKKSINLLNKGDAELKVAEEGREADCKVGYQVQCLLGIFEEMDNEKKPGMLEKCKKQKPTCPDKIDFPPIPLPHPCHPEPNEPCNSEWLETEYMSQTWFAKAPTTTCHPCHPPHPCKVTLYDGSSCAGWHADSSCAGWHASFPPGRYDTQGLRRKGAHDDAVSSIRVEAGCTATLYSNPDLTGSHWLFHAGEFSGTAFTDKFPDNMVSSMEVGVATPGVTKLKFGQDVNYPPYAYENEKGELAGFGKDIADGMTALCSDLEIEVVKTKWSDCWTPDGLGTGLEDGTLDACMTYTHTQGIRNKFADFSYGILASNKAAGLIAPLKNGNELDVNGLSDLAGKTVVDVAGWAPTADGLGFVENKCTKEKYSKNYKLLASTPDGSLEMILNGTADAMFVYADQAYNYRCTDASTVDLAWNCEIWSKFGKDFAYVQTGQFGYVRNGTTLALSKKGSGVPDMVNPCLAKFMETDEYHKICQKHGLAEVCYPNAFFTQADRKLKEYDLPTAEHAGPCSTGYCACPKG